jgi:hypothetical protein
VNGQDIVNSVDPPNDFYKISLFNNIIVNNVAAMAGGGISLQDVASVVMINNTIAHNDSTATGINAFGVGPLAPSTPQGAGIVSYVHGTALRNALIAKGVVGQEISNPDLRNNIIWQNRSFSYDPASNGGLGGLVAATPLVRDLAVKGAFPEGALIQNLNPLNCILSDATGFDASNIAEDPRFMSWYSNNLLTVAVAQEGGNFISVVFNPITPTGDYHIRSISPARDQGTDAVLAEIPDLALDIDREDRPNPDTALIDIGADEYYLSLPGAAILISPSGTTVTNTPTYVWNALDSVDEYYLWVNDSTGVRIQQWVTAADAGCPDGTGTCSVTPATQLAAGAAMWWIQAKNSLGTGPWSVGKSFTVSPPPAATLISPTGTITDNTPTYTWNASSGATWYRLWVNDSTGNKIQTWYPAADVGCPAGVGTCSVTPTTVLATGAGSWWIQAWSPVGYGPWSSGMSFTLIFTGAPDAATLVSPSGTIGTPTPEYIWNAVSGATWYRLWVNDSTGNKIQKWYQAADVGCATGVGNCSVTPTTVLAAGAASWWIQTYNDAGFGPWSSGMPFVVSPPGVATLISPDGRELVSTTPTYTWDAVSLAAWYHLWVNDSTGNRINQWYTAAEVGCPDGTGTCSVAPPTALAQGSARWWIQSWNPVGFSPWSGSFTFTAIPAN